MYCSKIAVSRKCLMLVADWLLTNWNDDMVLEGSTQADQDSYVVGKLILKFYIPYKIFLHLFTYCVCVFLCAH